MNCCEFSCGKHCPNSISNYGLCDKHLKLFLKSKKVITRKRQDCSCQTCMEEDHEL